jgi:tetratricopeptide (TPR) repeat protein
VAALLNDLGILQCNQKKLEEGKATHQRALAIRTNLLGGQHPNVANSWNNLGTIFRDEGNFEEALKCYENALAIRRNHFGEVKWKRGEEGEKRKRYLIINVRYTHMLHLHSTISEYCNSEKETWKMRQRATEKHLQ